MNTKPTPETHTGPFVPAGTRALLDPGTLKMRHPGLQLDKFSSGGTQKDHQGQAVRDVCTTRGDADTLAWALARRAPMLAGSAIFTARTEGPLTLHLSRASALENAGICLHPLYGFVYLPGSGLKGMARAWAETDGAAPEPDIRAVFGAAPDTVGSVVFHDAWPIKWPKLVPDIVNNHHPGYYQKSEPPGDWMDPVPVQFLAVAPGTTFQFAIAPRTGETDPALVEKAKDWLTHALSLRGAGAKTNAGYGTFVPVEGPRPTAPDPDLHFETTLELTSPAFLAGATQDGTDCDLRPATLRGLLRWWWRTLHAGQRETADLKAREALIWGDTKRSGAVRVTVSALPPVRAKPFEKDRSGTLPQDAGGRGRQTRGRGSQEHRQGLRYLSYGMDEKDGETGQIQRRHYLEPGARWTVTLSARDTAIPSDVRDLSVQQALAEARAALWLLCHCGGVGSKSRNGFGCFADIKVPDIAPIQERLEASPAEHGQPPPTPALEAALFREWPLQEDAWHAIDRAGKTIQALVKATPDKPARAALGMPRKPLKAGRDGRPPERHAAPYHLHVGKTCEGQRVLRFTGFPAPRLPDAAASREMLERLSAALDTEFGSGSGASGAPLGGARPSSPGSDQRRPAGAKFPRPGEVDGERVKVLSEDNDTYQVEYSDGEIGFPSKDEVTLL